MVSWGYTAWMRVRVGGVGRRGLQAAWVWEGGVACPSVATENSPLLNVSGSAKPGVKAPACMVVILVVAAPPLCALAALAKPVSERHARSDSSSRMLAGLKSQCTMLGLPPCSTCK
eukprot:scaffold60102_cov64-Phaeocystis_antarctica.AAC.4